MACAGQLDLDRLNTRLNDASLFEFVQADQNVSDPQRILQRSDWRPLEQEVPAFGRLEGALWLKTYIYSNTRQHALSLLELDYSLMDEIDVFILQPDKPITHYQTGSMRDFNSRPVPVRNFVFPLPTLNKSSATVLIRLKNQTYIQAPLTFWRAKSFIDNNQGEVLIHGLLFGVLILTAILSLTLYYFMRSCRYLVYSATLLSFVGFYATIKGINFQYLWPYSPLLNERSLLFFLGTCLICTCLITRDIYGGMRNLLWHRLTLAGVLSSAVIASAAFWLPRDMEASILSTLVVIVLLLCIAGTGISLFYRQHKLLPLGWFIFTLGILLLGFNRQNVLPRNPLTEYFLLVGLMLGCGLLTLAIIQYAVEQRKVRDKAQENANKANTRYYQLYQNAVEGVFTTSLNGELHTANPAMLKLLGCDSVESVQQVQRQHGVLAFFAHADKLKPAFAGAASGTPLVNELIEGCRENGTTFWANMSLKRIDGTEVSYLQGTLLDITENHQTTQQLEYLANHDPLTGLLNRRAFEEAAHSVLETCRENQDEASLMYIDLDQFKVVNDTCGHSAGDSLLKQLTEQIKLKVRDQGILARLGGDEFGIVLAGRNTDAAFVLAYRLLESIKDFRFIWEDRIFCVGASIGIAELDAKTQSLDQALSQADTACYAAKDSGRNRIHIYSQDDNAQQRQSEMQWVSLITESLESNRFELCHQPIYKLGESGTGSHYEILLRLKNHQGDYISPATFIPVAERFNLIDAIDRWVISHYFNWLSQHPGHMHDLSQANINLSGSSLTSSGFVAFVIQSFERYQIPYHKICFEITESAAIINLVHTSEFIRQLQQKGCRFALDDFGSGFSSYGYLKQLPVDFVKIDGSFVKDMLVDQVDKAMVKSIHDVAKAIGIKTVAEFVESEEILVALQAMGVDYAQGYAVAKPSLLDHLVTS